MQDKERGEGAKKNNQYQHCQQDLKHHVNCGVKSAIYRKMKVANKTNNQYQHCQKDIQHYVNCGVRSAR